MHKEAIEDFTIRGIINTANKVYIKTKIYSTPNEFIENFDDSLIDYFKDCDLIKVISYCGNGVKDFAFNNIDEAFRFFTNYKN